MDKKRPESALRALFDRAIELPEYEREAFVRGETEGGIDLRRRTMALLDAQDRAQLDPLVGLETESASQPTFKPGDRVGGTGGSVTIVRHLATGAAGEVYEAERASPKGRIAIKILRIRPSDPDAGRRLRAEGHLLAMLDHPGVVPVLGAGVADDGPAKGQPYLIMPMVDGEHLDEWAERTAPNPTRCAEMIAGIARAVHHANLRGVVHRDLKPSNILVDHDGRPRVVDFGVARLVADQPVRGTLATLGESIVGTPAYMAPEQFSPTARDVDLRADVYALGALLYELIAGVPRSRPTA